MEIPIPEKTVWCNIQVPSYHYRNSPCGDETILRSFISAMGFSILVKRYLCSESRPWTLKHVLVQFVMLNYAFSFAVARPNQELCQANGFIKLEATSGYLSSLVTEETGCGTSATPWILEALPGQQINLTLLDFTFNTLGSAFNLEYGDSFDGITLPGCRDLIVVKETDRETRLSNCFIRKRETLVYTSATNTIEVQVLPNREEDEPQFLLYYTGLYTLLSHLDLWRAEFILGDVNSSPLLPHICVIELDQQCFRLWLVAYSVPGHYPNQCCLIDK